jgi:hypothetical protein
MRSLTSRRTPRLRSSRSSAVIFGPSSANRLSLLGNPIGISLWSQCGTAGWQ